MTKLKWGRGSVRAADGAPHQILQSFDGQPLAGRGKRSYTHRQRRKEVSAMGFERKAAGDLEDLIYECKEVSASER